MSKIDVTTAVIVVVLVLALGFLGYQLYQLYLGQDPSPANPVASSTQPTDTIPEDLYNYQDDDGFLEDSTSFLDQPAASNSRNSGDLYEDNGPAAMGGGDYMVLAGNFLNKDNAEAEARRLRGLGFPSASVEPFDRGVYHVVLVDRFSTENSARSLVRQLASNHKVDAYVQKKRYRKEAGK